MYRGDARNSAPFSLDTNEPPATPIRQPSYAQLLVSSTDRYPDFVSEYTSSTTSSSWTLQRPNYLLQGYFTRLALTQLQMQMGLPTICATTPDYIGNDVFSLQIASAVQNTLIQTAKNFIPLPTMRFTFGTGLSPTLFTVGLTLDVVAPNSGNPFTVSGTVLSWSSSSGFLDVTVTASGGAPLPIPAQIWAATQYGGADSVVTVPQGYYTGTTLAAALQAAVRTATSIATFTVTFTNNVFVFSNATDARTFAFKNPVEISSGANAAVRIYNTIGVVDANVQEPAVTQTLGVPSMVFTRWIDICSSTLTKFQRVKDSTTLADTYTTAIARIYVAPPNVAPVGAATINNEPRIFTVDFANPKFIKWDIKEVLANFDIQVRDEYGALLWWTPSAGCEFQFTMLASES